MANESGAVAAALPAALNAQNLIDSRANLKLRINFGEISNVLLVDYKNWAFVSDN